MTRNLQTRVRKLENREDYKQFIVPEDGLNNIEKLIAASLTEIVEERFSENGDTRFAVVLCSEVKELAATNSPSKAKRFTDEKVENVCRDLIANSTGGTVVLVSGLASEF